MIQEKKRAFSLIELMIVIVIIGALTAIILPSFDVSESEAKKTASDASSYGTLSQLTKFHALYGAYPTRLHTGFEASSNTAGDTKLMGTTSGIADIPSYTWLNMAEGSSETARSGRIRLSNDTAKEIKNSLRKAGMYYLAAGGFSTSLTSSSSVNVAFVDLDVASSTTLSLCVINNNWYNSWSVGSDGLADTSALSITGDPISINGIPLPYYSYDDPFTAFSDPADTLSTLIITGAENETETDNGAKQDGIIIPLFITPATDWDYYYDQDGNKSEAMIGVSQVGACPWFEPINDFRYYIAIFKAYTDGSKAKLIGTLSPKCESINP